MELISKLKHYRQELATIDEQNPESGTLTDFDLSALFKAIDQVTSYVEYIHNYWLARMDPSSSSVLTLFPSIEQPSFWQVGSLMELNVGHTKEFTWKEELRLNTHMMAN